MEDDEEAFEKEALAAHNSYRAKHSVGPLVLDKQVIPIRENRPFELASNLIGNWMTNLQLCAYAKSWAVHLAKEGRFEHNPEQKYGENIYMFSSSNKNAKV